MPSSPFAYLDWPWFDDLSATYMVGGGGGEEGRREKSARDDQRARTTGYYDIDRSAAPAPGNVRRAARLELVVF